MEMVSLAREEHVVRFRWFDVLVGFLQPRPSGVSHVTSRAEQSRAELS